MVKKFNKFSTEYAIVWLSATNFFGEGGAERGGMAFKANQGLPFAHFGMAKGSP